ncbi:MAG: helix-turn-helix transcriptional regulator [Gammaproteobacteria bacterium]|nr:helix-turn-helix transcriptional regulator [Gammaproteobacteria bacterium]MBU2478524.1 helix-turn-helix transcriptional regulator [Gammaproteobacteria bacterium]
MSTALNKIQVIHSLDGEPEYVLLPYTLYQALQGEFKHKLVSRTAGSKADYVSFDIKDYVDNPVALARIKARMSQSELARRMDVSQAYISKIERQDQVTAKLLQRVMSALNKKKL